MNGLPPEDDITPADAEFAARVRRRLDAGLDAQDALTLARLRAARLNALTVVPRRPAWAAALPLAAACAALAIALGHAHAPLGAAPGLDDVELLADREPLEFYQDLEFYAWLALDDPAP
ncbi:MAG: hypothetical protein AB7I01_10720 [Gammaproteobacteria bacterium]